MFNISPQYTILALRSLHNSVNQKFNIIAIPGVSFLWHSCRLLCDFATPGIVFKTAKSL